MVVRPGVLLDVVAACFFIVELVLGVKPSFDHFSASRASPSRPRLRRKVFGVVFVEFATALIGRIILLEEFVEIGRTRAPFPQILRRLRETLQEVIVEVSLPAPIRSPLIFFDEAPDILSGRPAVGASQGLQLSQHPIRLLRGNRDRRVAVGRIPDILSIARVHVEVPRKPLLVGYGVIYPAAAQL